MASFPNAPGRLVLVVDDDPTVLCSITAALAVAGLRVIVAKNGSAGLEAFFGSAEEPDRGREVSHRGKVVQNPIGRLL